MSSEQQERRRAYQERVNEFKVFRAQMMPFIRFLKKRGLKFKHANVQNMRVQYFRMDMFKEILQKHEKQIREDSRYSEVSETIQNHLLFFKRPSNLEKRKYPQALEHVEEGKKGKFAAFKFDTTQSKKWMVVTLLVVVAAAVLFPLWPYELKYGVWLVSFSFLMFLLSVLILRLVIYVIFAIFGVSFWVFPCLLGDKGPIDSFKPLYSIQKWDSDISSIIGRVLALIIFSYYAVSIYQDPDFYLENLQSTKQAMGEFHDWGVDKIKGEAGNFSQRALSMQKIINETADAFEEQKEQL